MATKKSTRSKKTDKSPIAAFESSLQELEKLVEQMEHGNLSLQETLQHFEQGVKLTNLCQQALTAAEQKVEVLQKKAQESIQALDTDLFEEE